MNPQREGTQLLLLGIPCVLHDGRELLLRTRKELALIAYLSLEGRSTRAKLAELLWTSLERASGLANLRRELFRLRATPLGSLLEIHADTLGLRSPVSTDATDFRNHLAADRLSEALALYRGPLLEVLDLQGAEGFEAWLTDARAGFHEAHQAALSRQADALEASGDLRGALSAHLRRLRFDELQESVHVEVIRLHALLGERELALQRFARLTSVLADGLGLTPLPETAALAERVRLTNAHQVPQSYPQAMPFLLPPLVGREEVWNALFHSTAEVCLIVSDAGVGKSRLTQDFAHSRGTPVVLQGLEAFSLTPLSPVAAALRRALTGPAHAQLATLKTVWRQEAAWLVPELSPDAVVAAPSPEGRDRFLEGLARALAAAAGSGGTVIVDDLHWCDASTVEVAFHLARLASGGEFRILTNARPSELQTNEAASQMLASLKRDGKLHRTDLEALGALDVLELIRSLSGGQRAQLFAKRLHDATAGNPLYLLETLRFLFASGLLSVGDEGWVTPYDEATSDYAELPIPPSVSAAVLGRVDALGGPARRLLELASLAGDGFRLEGLVGASALTEWEQVETLERARSFDLVVPFEGGYRFSHELMRRALERDISPERRALSHRKLAENLARVGGAPGQIAEHLERAGQPARAVEYRILAAAAAARVFAHREALDQFALALNDGPGAAVGVEVHLARAELFTATADYPGVEAELRRATTLARDVGDSELIARVGLAEAGLQNALGRYGETLRLTEGLLKASLLPSQLIARVRYEQGSALLRLGRLDEAESCLEAALVGVPSDAHDLIGRLNTLRQACAMQRGLLTLAQSHNAAALEAFKTAGSRVGAAKALGGKGLLIGLLGDARTAVQVLTEALLEARELGDVGIQRTLLLNLFKFLLEASDLETAMVRLEEGLALAREPQDPHLEGIFLNNLGTVHRLRGDLGGALSAVSQALELADRSNISQHRIRRRITLAENHLDLGDLAGAQGLLLEVQGLTEPTGRGELNAWYETLLARLDLAGGAPRSALARLEALLQAETPIDVDDRARIAWVAGLSHLALGDPGEALRHVSRLALPLDPLLRGWLLSIRLAAVSWPEGPDPRDLSSAEELLASKQMLPLESVGLERALAACLALAGEADRAGVHLRSAQRRVERLASSLDGFPALRQSFLLRYNAT